MLEQFYGGKLMKSYAPDKRSLIILRIAITVSALALIAAAKIFIKIYALMMTLSIIFAAAALVLMLVYLPMYFSGLSYSATDTEISKCSGVFFKTVQSIKYSSIQYSTFVTTPFSRHTGLNFIIFYVYGGKFLLLFLKSSDAGEILKNSGSVYCRGE